MSAAAARPKAILDITLYKRSVVSRCVGGSARTLSRSGPTLSLRHAIASFGGTHRRARAGRRAGQFRTAHLVTARHDARDDRLGPPPRRLRPAVQARTPGSRQAHSI